MTHELAKAVFGTVIMISVGACSSTTISRSSGGIGAGFTPSAELVTLAEDGSIPDQNFQNTGTRGSFSDLRSQNGRVSGFAYQYGRVEGTNRFLGVAGIAPNTDAGAAPTTATATYTGDYALSYVDRDRAENRKGTISLDADFNSGTLEGRAGALDVAGTIDGQTVGGTASYRGVEADMTGVIGSERTVTAFAGNSDEAVLVGGINAEIDD
ncbi:hypothetical protein [Erythrobacter sp. YT30]|uniref:hypothetical protein n=1 Tax=Erythrobacter sp. YT30 TaxID=1735012 RepID=UPI00076BCC1D|nr:hypothetical protein [Erythrobacter sp. YT30]KWV91046.1 hypothetical protein AUC45_06925 [Erythrobacter sp. YT30]